MEPLVLELDFLGNTDAEKEILTGSHRLLDMIDLCSKVCTKVLVSTTLLHCKRTLIVPTTML